MAQNDLQSILSQFFQNRDPFSSLKSQFTLDKKGKIKINPLTGEKIAKGDRRKFKKFKANPLGRTAGSAINPFVPQAPNLFGGLDVGANNPIAKLLGGGGR